jgi:DNA (cytosine-5)-methyltransferase 1
MTRLMNDKIQNRIFYKTIDLFAGIGGIRLGFDMTKRVKNVFSAEIDKYACETYKINFGGDPQCDITKIDEKKLPDFDILLAGFPCQAFSIAGRRGGFEDTRGTLFFHVARMIKEKQPKAFLLENVKGLTHHDGGKTLSTIMNVLEHDLGYTVYSQLLNAKDYGIPQKRERIYIVGFKKETDFEFPKPKKLKLKIKDIMEKDVVSSKYYLSNTYLQTLKNHRTRHEKKGNGFGYEIVDSDGIANTIVVGGMGKERNLLYDNRLTNFQPVTNIKGEINRDYIRKMTPREWARLQGFPDSYKIPVSDAQAYKQFGNSVSVPVIHEIAKLVIEKLDSQYHVMETKQESTPPGTHKSLSLGCQ